MGFLNPFLLFGLLSAAVPLLIHLWSRRQARTVDFSTLRFLLEAHRRTVRRFQLEQWLILALRALALALIALALARPVLHGGNLFAQAQMETSVVLLLDNSASMGYRGVDGVPFERAKERAVQILRSLRPGDTASLILVSDRVEVLFEPGTAQRSDVIQAIRAAPLTARSTRIETALERGIDLLRRSQAPNKELYLISDFSAHGWTATSIDAGEIRLFFVPVGDAAPGNVGVVAFDVTNPLVAADIPATFTVRLHNFGETPVSDRTVELLVEGEVRGTITVDIPPGGDVQERFQHAFESAGLYDVRVRLSEDRFPLDDERILIVPVLGQIRAYTVGKDPFYLSLALNPTAFESPRAVFTVQPTTLSYAELRDRPLDEADVLLLQDPPLSDGRLMGRVRNFLLNGGAVLLFMGERSDPSATASLDWFPARSEGIQAEEVPVKLRPTHLAPASGSPRAEAISRTIFGIFEGDPWERPAAPNFYKIHRLVPKEGAEVVATFSDGTPAVIATRIEGGRLLVVNTPASGTEWSNLPLNPAFLPIVQQMVFFVHAPATPPKRNLEVGEPYVRPLRATDPLRFTVWTPSGDHRTIGRTEDGSNLRYTETEAVGVYRIVGDGQGDSAAFTDTFAVNAAGAESDLTPIDRETVTARIDGAVEWLDRLAETGDFGVALQTRRLGRELWFALLVLAVLVLIVETAVANRRRREDDGAETSALAQ